MLFCERHIEIDAKQANINKITRTFFPKQAKNYSLWLSKEKIQPKRHKLFKKIINAVCMKNRRFILGLPNSVILIYEKLLCLSFKY